MLYEKCKEMLVVDISMEIRQLETIRKTLSLVDERCMELSLLDVENLWSHYNDWHGYELEVDNDWMKRFVRWISEDLIHPVEMLKIFAGIDTLFDTK